MHRLMIAGAAMLALAACGPRNDAGGANNAAATQPSAAPDANPAATVPTPANEAGAPDFVAKAATSDMFEIESSRLALERTRNPQVRAFAEMMVTAHSATTQALQAAISTSGQALTPPTTMPSNLQDAMNDLRSTSAEGFDAAYMNAQVDRHQDALNVMQRYAQDGDVPALQAFAASTAPAVQQHLEQARRIRDALS